MNGLAGITITCFAASYATSLLLEVARLLRKTRARTLLMIGFTVAGLLAHTLFLFVHARRDAAGAGIVPWSSWQDFCLLAAWVLAAAFLALTIRRPENAVGLFLLPLVLALVGLAVASGDAAAFPRHAALNAWRTIHGLALLLGTVAVTLGFATGTMYLVQAYRLKHKLPPRPGFRLPSLEWLQRFNRESLAISTLLLAVGLVSGVVLNIGRGGAVRRGVEWTDPIVLSSGVLFGWLLVSMLFEAFYKPARQGRKVAYLTLASFLFLLMALGFVLLGEHATAAAATQATTPLGAATALVEPGGPMKLQVVGCSHHTASVELRERLAFSPAQARDALLRLRSRYPRTEAVVLSTCNRVELYFAAEQSELCPSHHEVVEFLAEFHGLEAVEVFDELFERSGEDAVRHLFTVAASLDSMVVGEAQILSQVKQAYEEATSGDCTGPLTHAAFQAAIRVAKRVARETAINQKRVSIPSVAVADFAKQFFERFDNKQILVIGAGEMGEETLRYLIDEGGRQIAIVNRHQARAAELASRVAGQVHPWETLPQQLVQADLVVSTTGASEPIVDLAAFQRIVQQRAERPVFILDLAVPRDFDPRIGEQAGVYLYSVDDLRQTCELNRRAREQEWPRAERIIEDETARFMSDLHHRATGPTIRRLKEQADATKSDELTRLFNKLGQLEPRQIKEIQQSFDRLVNKLLHPPLESLRGEAGQDTSQTLLDALKRLFQIHD